MSIATFPAMAIDTTDRQFAVEGLQTGWPLSMISSLTCTVPKEFVHRAAVAEVLLTGWRRQSDTHFTVAAQWPRAHSFFTPVDGQYDPLLGAETIRQVGSLLSHAEFGVPFGHQFLMWDLHYTVHPPQLRVGAAPADLEMEIECTSVRRRGGRLAGLRYEATIHSGGQLIASGGASFDCTSPEVYRRVRGDRAVPQLPGILPAAVSPTSVGRGHTSDVVLSPTDRPDRWQLRADTHHPVLFDHPVDHIPGMVLLEAARQAGRAVSGGTFVPTQLHSEFSRYAEMDSPCWIEVQEVADAAPGLRTLRVTGHQDDQPVFSCVLSAPRQQD